MGTNLASGYPSRVKKIACFYDHTALKRGEEAKVGPSELKPALGMCNYLIYGYVGFHKERFELKSLEKDIDLPEGKNNFIQVTELKKEFPQVKFLLSVGGFHDLDHQDKYFEVLESKINRDAFITSAIKFVKHYNFDGLDLAWQFPVMKEKKEQSSSGSPWSSVKGLFTSSGDSKQAEHREQFSALVKELGAALSEDNLVLTLSVLPHIDSSAYFDPLSLNKSLEHVHLMTFDYQTPERTKTVADYSTPLQYVENNDEKRDPEQNVEATVNWWLNQRMPAEKLLIGIPTFGRTWKLTKKSGATGSPLVKYTDGPGDKGPYLKNKGQLAYFEICPLLSDPAKAAESTTILVRVRDPISKQGTYAYRVADEKSGIWVSYEEPETVAEKMLFVKNKGLGGAVVVDLSLDDFKTDFPILKAVKHNLM